jgi:hypothetical protein
MPATRGDIRKESPRVFVKPLKDLKAFTGLVVSSKVGDLISTSHIPNEMELLASEPVNFLTEYRILVHHKRIVAVRHYSGDPTLFPDMRVASEAIESFAESPCAYSLDLGIVQDGRTLIVEVNDAFSLGGYGTHPLIYTPLIIDRWVEMTTCSSLVP